MRYLSLSEVFELHERLIATSGGTGGIRDIHLLESAVSQPRVTFDKHDLSIQTWFQKLQLYATR